MKQELRGLTIIVHALAQDIKNSKEKAEQRHENLLLQIENRLLKAEKSLPATGKKTRSSSQKAAKKSL
jgi:ElaB/YqjD/DUF883 family membrane-anchored ribosome-binding protein